MNEREAAELVESFFVERAELFQEGLWYRSEIEKYCALLQIAHNEIASGTTLYQYERRIDYLKPRLEEISLILTGGTKTDWIESLLDSDATSPAFFFHGMHDAPRASAYR